MIEQEKVLVNSTIRALDLSRITGKFDVEGIYLWNFLLKRLNFAEHKHYILKTKESFEDVEKITDFMVSVKYDFKELCN